MTEKSLEEFLEKYFPIGNWIHNKKLEGTKYRPDYRSDTLKIIVEFDGYQHYTKAKNVSDDLNRNLIFSQLGYKVIRIPYFVQLSEESIKFFFNLDVKGFKQEYPHGFIDEKVVFPSDFCEFGVKRFKRELDALPEKITYEIQISLRDKFMNGGDEPIYVYLPNSLVKEYGLEDDYQDLYENLPWAI